MYLAAPGLSAKMHAASLICGVACGVFSCGV